MKKSPRRLFLLALFILAETSVYSGEKKPPIDQIESIQTLYATAQQWIRNKEYAAAHFNNVGESDRWVKADGKSHEGEDVSARADVYSNDDNVFYIKSALAPPSGDWSCVSEYYFQPDQSLAFIYTELRTFTSAHEGGILAAIRHYYDHGKLLRKTEQEFDLNDPKQLVPKNERGYFKVGCPLIYSDVSRFPFYSLLKKVHQ